MIILVGNVCKSYIYTILQFVVVLCGISDTFAPELTILMYDDYQE